SRPYPHTPEITPGARIQLRASALILADKAQQIVSDGCRTAPLTPGDGMARRPFAETQPRVPRQPRSTRYIRSRSGGIPVLVAIGALTAGLRLRFGTDAARAARRRHRAAPAGLPRLFAGGARGRGVAHDPLALDQSANLVR